MLHNIMFQMVQVYDLVQWWVPEGPVAVVSAALLERELGARRRGDGAVEAVLHAAVHVAREERLERVVQRRVALQHATRRYFTILRYHGAVAVSTGTS